MTIAELIGKLKGFPHDMRVVYPITQKYCDINTLTVTRDIDHVKSGPPPWPMREIGDPYLVLEE
jgi:hypothetical protein